MLVPVFIGKLSPSTLKWVPCARVSVIFRFWHHFVLAKLATSIIRVNYWIDFFLSHLLGYSVLNIRNMNNTRNTGLLTPFSGVCSPFSTLWYDGAGVNGRIYFFLCFSRKGRLQTCVPLFKHWYDGAGVNGRKKCPRLSNNSRFCFAVHTCTIVLSRWLTCSIPLCYMNRKRDKACESQLPSP